MTVLTLLRPDTTSAGSMRSTLILLGQSRSPAAAAAAAAAVAKSLQSCPILCDPIDGSPPDPIVSTDTA